MSDRFRSDDTGSDALDTVRHTPSFAEGRRSTASRPDLAFPSPASDDRTRYEQRNIIGAGGMGDVFSCRDTRIGRDVAMKTLAMAHADTEIQDRFYQEARIQAQLEHPAIVPVYDVGHRADGRPYFTMKRVRGDSLEEVIDGLRRKDPAVVGRTSKRRLIVAFNTVCLAVAYAHTRGVVHRDLKPGNIMLGEFGEVLVLDWGIAKVTGAPAEETPLATDLEETEAGIVYGTIGYMAPEQLAGLGVGETADVFALGAILFEILTLERFMEGHPVGVPKLRPEDADDAERARYGLSPELESIIRRATHPDPAQRIQSPRVLSEAIERYLDGERDLERRRDQARHHAERAAALATGPDAAPVAALREASLSMALDPGQSGALDTLVNLMTDPSAVPPPEARAAYEARTATERERARRVNTYGMATVLSLLPFMAWLGIRDVPLFAAFVGAIVAALFAMVWHVRRRRSLPTSLELVGSAVVHLAIVPLAFWFGPFLFLPGIVVAVHLVGTSSVSRAPLLRTWSLAMGLATLFVPALFDAFGWVDPAYGFRDGLLWLSPRLTSFPELPTTLLLAFAGAASLVIPARVNGRNVDALMRAEQRVFDQAWRLQQLLPEAVRSVVASATTENGQVGATSTTTGS